MTSIPTKMKTEIIVTLLFVAVAGALSDGASGDEDTGVCPGEYMRKHPDIFTKKKDLQKKYGHPDFSKLKTCSGDEQCANGRKCCKTPCGRKCMPLVFESNALDTLEQIMKEIGTGPDDAPYEATEEDRKYGMCPDNYMKTHPEIKEKYEKKWEHHRSQKHGEKCAEKHSHKQCKHGEECAEEHSHKQCKHGEQCEHHKKHKHFNRFMNMTDCSADGECSNGLRCCNTMCGKKCMKPVFTDEDLKESLFGKHDKKKKNRMKRDVAEEDEQTMDDDDDDEMEHGRGHGKGLERGKGHKKRARHGNGQGKGEDHEMCQGEECEEGHGGGEEHGKGHGRGADHGKGHGRGEKHGKGHGKGADHGKGCRKGAENGKGHGKRRKHGKGGKKGEENGEGHREGLENVKYHAQGGEDEVQGEELFRNKRSLNSLGNSHGNNDGNSEMQEGSRNGKGKCKGKGKGKKNGKGKKKGGSGQ